MGYGGYDYDRSVLRSRSYSSKNRDEIFNDKFSTEMNPKGVILRESRDSIEHPNSVPIVIGLDVTGSMGYIPEELIKSTFPTVMKNIINAGIQDPQVLFMGIGDHIYDDAPLQVGQFESSDELLEKWLKLLWIEGGGGGNSGESYMLPWYFAGKYTSTDSFEKRGRKGILITIGDEPILQTLEREAIKEFLVDNEEVDFSTKDIVKMAQEKYEVYHILIQTHPHFEKAEEQFKALLGENNVFVTTPKGVAQRIIEIIIKNLNRFVGVLTELPTSIDTLNNSNREKISIEDMIPEGMVL